MASAPASASAPAPASGGAPPWVPVPEGLPDAGQPDADEEVAAEVFAPCWNCRTAMADRDERCPSCGGTRTHALLCCADPRLELRHGPGGPLRLGRDPAWAPRTAGDLADRLKVSRRHAALTVEPDGSAWVEEPAEGTRNGTFVNGARVAAGVRTPLRDGDQLRLGLRISFTVRLYGPGPPGTA
ncbi:FHA domain-containing protein, partial [Streptomyces sp. NPDC055078]